jgi:predicted transcriptional regulator
MSPFPSASQNILPGSPASHPPVPPNLSLGFIIRRIREAGSLSQSELARLTEANLSYISTVESGTNNISIRKMLLICNALRIPCALLMTIQQNIAGSAAIERT